MSKHEQNFWKVYNSSRCKTTMTILSIIVVLALVTMELLQIPSDRMWEAFLIVIGYWVGRGTKIKDK